MTEQRNTQNTQYPGYPSFGVNQTYMPSTSTPTHFTNNAGHVGTVSGTAAYPYSNDPSSPYFQANYPRDNLPNIRLNDLAQLQECYNQIPGSHPYQGQPTTEWSDIDQGAQYPGVLGVPGTAFPARVGGTGVPTGGYFGPGASFMPVPTSNQTASFGDGPEFTEIPMTADGKRYRCECGHETKTTGDMMRHHETSKHSGARYACTCGKRYYRKDGLTRHEKQCPKRNT